MSLLLYLSSIAQAASFDPVDPQLRLGFHASGQDAESRHRPVIHLIFPNTVVGTNAHLYGGWKHRLNKAWSLETLVGVGLQTGGTSPIGSLHLERADGPLYLWADLEYAPLFHHNMYGYLTVAWVVGNVMVGVDTENWVNLERSADLPLPFEGYWSVGPQVSLALGQHLFMEEALLWNGSELIPRTYFHLSF